MSNPDKANPSERGERKAPGLLDKDGRATEGDDPCGMFGFIVWLSTGWTQVIRPLRGLWLTEGGSAIWVRKR